MQSFQREEREVKGGHLEAAPELGALEPLERDSRVLPVVDGGINTPVRRSTSMTAAFYVNGWPLFRALR